MKIKTIAANLSCQILMAVVFIIGTSIMLFTVILLFFNGKGKWAVSLQNKILDD